MIDMLKNTLGLAITLGSGIRCFVVALLFMEVQIVFCVSLETIPSICHLQCKDNMNGSATFNFCESHTQLRLVGRCCVNQTDNGLSVLGIDLKNCGITEHTFSGGIINITSLEYISLEKNKLKQLRNEDFHRNLKIVYLSLPPNLECPGREGTWLNQSSDPSAIYCLFEQNTCDVYNVTCPSNSHCEHSGMDMTECLCDAGFHGYKCLEQGVFPTTSFIIGIIIPTVVLSIFMYFTQRRYVVQPSNRKLR